MLAHRRRGRRAARNERGAVLVEMAVVALLLVTLLAGTFDYGMAWRVGLATNEASRTAARVGSARSAERDADYAALSGAKAALDASGQLDKVQRVVIFRSLSANGRMPQSCRTGSGTGCQVITGDQFRTAWETRTMDQATHPNGCLRVATSRSWCPTSRINAQSSADHYGVWIMLRQDHRFPIMGDGVDIERTTVMRLEPKPE